MKNIFLTIVLIAVCPVLAFADTVREFNKNTFDSSLTWSTASLSCALRKMDNMTYQQIQEIVEYINGMSDNGITNGAFTIRTSLLGAICISVLGDADPEHKIAIDFVETMFKCHNDRVEKKQNSTQQTVSQKNFNMDKQTGVNPDGVADAQMMFEQAFARKCIPGFGTLGTPGHMYSGKKGIVNVDHTETTCTPRSQNRYDCVMVRFFTDGFRCKTECTDWRPARGDSRNLGGSCSSEHLYR